MDRTYQEEANLIMLAAAEHTDLLEALLGVTQSFQQRNEKKLMANVTNIAKQTYTFCTTQIIQCTIYRLAYFHLFHQVHAAELIF